MSAVNKKNDKVILVTGASSGIGGEICRFLAEKGFTVYGTSRKKQTGSKLKPPFKFIQLDVTSEKSAKEAVRQVVEAEGRLDILINNAGFGLAGAIEDTEMNEVLAQFDTNFFGVVRMCKAALPVMRRQKEGRIINITSVGGIYSLPFQTFYSASKFALEALTAGLRIEAKPFGIKVVAVEPGEINTPFTEHRVFASGTKKNSIYKKRFTSAINFEIHSEEWGDDPGVVAKQVYKIIRFKYPSARYAAGFANKFLVFLKRIFPGRLIEFIIAMVYGGKN